MGRGCKSEPTDDIVSLAIAGTGADIDPASSEHIFDALYTTKGAGLGLGLSACRKIVNVHGGRLWVEENGRRGTRFAFILPLRQSIQVSASH
jgi:signal transduction histidine kinase